MDDAERAVAILLAVDEDAEAEDVGKLLEADRLSLHLREDRIGRLQPPEDFGLDAVLGEPRGQVRSG